MPKVREKKEPANPADSDAERREAWLVERQSGIGGSDIGPIAGLNPWRGPIDVWREKLGEVQPVRRRMELGLAMEPVLRDFYQEDTGREMRRNTRLFRHPETDFLVGTPDGFTTGESRRIVSFKCVERKATSDWGSGPSEVPGYVIAQEVWYLGIMAARGIELECADVYVCFGGAETMLYRVDPNPDFFKELRGLAIYFWPYVEAKKAPPLDGTEGAWDYLHAHFPKPTTAEFLTADDEMEKLAGEYRHFKAQADEVDRQLETTRQMIAVKIGDASGVLGSFGKFTFASRKGNIRWKDAAMAHGVTEAAAEPFRGADIRPLMPYLKKGAK